MNVGKNKYEIMFHGGDDQDEMAATQYAIIRAAEVGKQNNFGYFRIVNSKKTNTRKKSSSGERGSMITAAGDPTTTVTGGRDMTSGS